MGFPSVCYCIVMPEPLVYLVNFLDQVYLMVRLAFFYLGLFDPTHLAPPGDNHMDHITLVHHPSPLSPSITSKLIKKSLPVVEFAEFAERSGRYTYREDDQKEACIVCLGCLEGDHQIRELSNCFHAFHSGCLDKWVDYGQTTCPMCRSKLLPEGYERKAGNRLWVVGRISHLFQ